MTTKIMNAVRSFKNDEDGNEVLQSVMLVALAALIGAALKTLASSTYGKANTHTTAVVDGAVGAAK